MLDAIDTFWEYTSGRMATINPNRKMIGVADAMDWPPKSILFEGFYLLVLGEKPVLSREAWSASTPIVVHTCQFSWIIAGQDLTQGVVGRSRGSKYRTNMTMREEILKATYPGFCQKQSWAVLGNSPSGLMLQGTPKQEYITWGPLTFLNRQDKSSGVIYGAATVEITDMTETITA